MKASGIPKPQNGLSKNETNEHCAGTDGARTINTINNLSKTQKTLPQNYEIMQCQLEKENKKIRYVENENSTSNIINHAEEDTNGECNVKKPATPTMEEIIFQTKGIKQIMRWKTSVVGTLGMVLPQRIKLHQQKRERRLFGLKKRGNNGHKVIPQAMRKKMMKAKQMFDLSQTRVITEPSPTAVYFRNLKRGINGNIGEALRDCLSTCALLDISFVEESVMEVVTDQRLEERLIANFEVMNV